MLTTISATLGKLAIALTLLSTVLAAQTPSPLPPASIWDGYAQLKRICAAESNYDPTSEPRQRLPDGSLLWGWQDGKIIKRDIGACQINLKVWGTTASAMGLDVVNSEDDNIAFAKWLYDRYGWKPWSASKGDWGK